MSKFMESHHSDYKIDTSINTNYPAEFGESWRPENSRPPKELVDYLLNLKVKLKIDKNEKSGGFDADLEKLMIPAPQIKDEFPDKESTVDELTQKFIEKRGGKLMEKYEILKTKEATPVIKDCEFQT